MLDGLEAMMGPNEHKRQLERLRTALNKFNDETGGCRTREADVAFYEAWSAMTVMAAEVAA
ncbi:MAG: hypothetical protein HRU00_09785 [Myxococcales bacterium]|nr:hypothetical protein [Myxococcales bacterium]